MELSFDDVKSMIEQAKSQTSYEQRGARNEVNIAYLPDGKHKIRFIVDPNKKMMRTFNMHRINKKRLICNNFLRGMTPAIATVNGIIGDQDLQDLKSVERCKVCEGAKTIGSWRAAARPHMIIYGLLIETDAPGDYWKPGTLYAIVINTGKFRTAFDSQLEALASDAPEYLLTAFNPTASGGMFNVQISRGAQGSVSISPSIGKMCDPVATSDKNWVPLSEILIKTTFNKADYDAAVEHMELASREYSKFKLETQVAERNGQAKPPFPAILADLGATLTTDDEEEEGSDKKSADAPAPSGIQTPPAANSLHSPAPTPAPAATPPAQPAPWEDNKAEAPAPTQAPASSAPVVVYKSKQASEPQDGCFGSFNDSQSECLSCAHNIDCMTKTFE